MLLLQTARAGRAAFTLLFLSSLVTVPPPEEPGLIFDESLILPAPSPPLPPTPIANETIPVHKEEPPRPDPPAWLLSLDIDPVVWFLWHNVVAAAVSRKLLGVISTALSPATKGSQDRVPATAQGDKCDQPVQIDDDMRLDKEDLMAELDVYRDAVAALVQAKKKLQGELDLHLAKPWAPIVAPLVNAQDVSRIKQDKVSSIVLVLDSIEATMRPKLVDRLETHLRNSACHRVLQAHIYYVNDVASKDHLFNALDPSVRKRINLHSKSSYIFQGNHCRDRPMMTVVAYDARKSQPAIFVPSSLDRLLVKRTRLGTGKLVTSLNEAQIGVLVRLVLHAISAVHGWTPIVPLIKWKKCVACLFAFFFPGRKHAGKPSGT